MYFTSSTEAQCVPPHPPKQHVLHCFIKHHVLLLIYPSTTCSSAPSSHHMLPHIHLGAICSKLSTEAPCASPCPSRHHVLHLFHPRTTCSTSSIQVPHASLLHQNPMCSTSSIQVPCAPLIHQDPMCSTSSIQVPCAVSSRPHVLHLIHPSTTTCSTSSVQASRAPLLH